MREPCATIWQKNARAWASKAVREGARRRTHAAWCLGHRERAGPAPLALSQLPPRRLVERVPLSRTREIATPTEAVSSGICSRIMSGAVRAPPPRFEPRPARVYIRSRAIPGLPNILCIKAGRHIDGRSKVHPPRRPDDSTSHSKCRRVDRAGRLRRCSMPHLSTDPLSSRSHRPPVCRRHRRPGDQGLRFCCSSGPWQECPEHVYVGP